MKRFGRLLWITLFGLLIVSASIGVMAQDFTANDQGELALQETVSGTLTAGSRDQYTLNVTQDGTLNIFLDGSGDMDTYLRVYHAGESEPFAENDDRGDGSLFSAVEGLSVVAGDTLLIEVGTYADTGEGEYQLRAAPPAALNSIGAASLESPLAGTLANNTRDRYTLDVPETAVFNIAADGAGILDTYLRIYRAGDESPAVQNDDVEQGNLSSGFTNIVIPGGSSLIIEVGSYGDAGEGDYTLSITPANADMSTVDPVSLADTDQAALCADAETAPEPTRFQYLAPEQVMQDGVDYGAVFCTAAGNFLVDLYEADAPITVNSFIYLAQHHFFDQTTFHRVIEDFVVQGGDPTGTGLGGPGYEFVNETDNDLSFGGIGVLGMANAGPDTNGSQFFITLAPVNRLDGNYTIFGQVELGMASVFGIDVRDPETAEVPGTTIYTVKIVTYPQQ